MAVELEDVRGVVHTFDHPPRRVVSLVPSITETLFDLGVGSSIVGVTDWCIFPPSLDVPGIGGTKNPDVDAIRKLQPDLVHVNLEENVEKHAAEIERFSPVFATEPKSPGDVVDLIRSLGVIHGCVPAAENWVVRIEHERARERSSSFTFACPIWRKPWMWCGGDTYVSALVEEVGGRNVLSDRERYPSIDIEDVVWLAPDIVFLPDEPYAFTEDDAEDLRGSFSGRVVGPFPGHLFTWHGTRTLLGLQALRDWI